MFATLSSYLDSKSILFELINNFRLYDRICIVSALRSSKYLPEVYIGAKRRLTKWEIGRPGYMAGLF
jgi:hypothetical protein